MITVGLLTVSDRCFHGQAEDLSGPRLKDLIKTENLLKAEIVLEACVPDEKHVISSKLVEWSDVNPVDVIFTLGGTGFSPRDVTPEATKEIIEREAPGLSIAMIKGSLEITPLAMLSRPVSGIRKKSIIVNLPGSPKAVGECFKMIAPALTHAVQLINGSKEVEKTHTKMQAEEQPGLKTKHFTHTCKHHSRDPEAVAFRPRQSNFPMISVEEAQQAIMNNSLSLIKEEVYYLDSIGRMLAEDIIAKDPLPPFPASMKDGYAVLASDGKGLRKVIGASIAGSHPEEIVVQPGFCARISTGAPLPPGADAVVMVEDTLLVESSEDGKVEKEIDIKAEVRIGQEIRPIGCDIGEGETVLRQGTLITAADVGILATVGQIKVLVYAKPKVAVLSTGNELQEPSPDLANGKIRDSNRPALLSLLKQHNITVVDGGIASDDPDVLYEHIKKAFNFSEILVSTGGVSMGEKDLLRHVLIEKFNAKIHFGRVDMKPGKPTTFATCEYEGRKKLVFALPGNPVSAVVTCHLYVIPACRKISGHTSPFPTKVKAEFYSSDNPFVLDSRPEYHRVCLQWKSDAQFPRALSTGNQLSSRLLSLNSANGLAIMPAKTSIMPNLASGSLVDVLIIDSV